MNRRIFWYFALNILVFALLVAGTAFVMRPVQRKILAGMTEFRDLIIRNGEEFLGFRIEYRSLGPSVFGYFDIREPVIFGDPDGPYPRSSPLVSMDRLRISFSVWRLLAGDPAGALRSLRVDRPVISVAPGENPELRRLLARFQGGSPEDGAEKPFRGRITRSLRVSIRRGECVLRFGDSSAGFQGLSFDAFISPEEIRARGKWSVSLLFAPPGKSRISAGLTGRLEGSYGIKTRTGFVTLNIPAIQGEGFTVSAINFGIWMDENGLEITKTADRIPCALSFDWDYRTGRVSGEFRADNFSPRQMLMLQGSLRRHSRFLGMRLDGAASFAAGGGEAPSWNLDMNGSLASVGPFGFVNWKADAGGNGESAWIRRLEADFPHGGIGYTGRLGFSPLAPDGVLSLRAFSVSGNGTAEGDIRVESPGGVIRFESDWFRSGDVPPAALRGELVPAPGKTWPGDFFFSLAVERGGGTRRLAGEIPGPGEAEFFPSADLPAPGPALPLDPGTDSRLGNYTAPERAGQEEREPGGEDGGEPGPFPEDGTSVSGRRFPEGGISVAGDWSANPRGLQASLEVEAVPLRELWEMARPFARLPFIPGFAEKEAASILVSTDFFLNTDFGRISWNAPRILAEREGPRPLEIAASVSGTDRRFSLEGGSVRFGDEAVNFSALLDMEDPDDIFFSVMADYRDLAWVVQGALLEKNALGISGSYDISGSFRRSPAGVVSGWLQAGPLPLPLGDHAALSLGLSFRFGGLNDWDAVLDRFEISGIPVSGSQGAVFSATGQANQEGGFLGELGFDDGRNPLSGQAWFARQDSGWNGEARLEGMAGAESCGLGFLWQEGGEAAAPSLEISLTADRLQLGRFFRTSLGPHVTGTANFRWDTGDDWELSVNLRNLGVRQGETALEAGGQLRLDRGRFQATNFSVMGGGLALFFPRIDLRLAESSLEGSGRLAGTLLGRSLETDFRAVLEAGPMNSWADIAEAAGTLELRLDVDRLAWETMDPAPPFSLVFHRAGGKFELEGGPGNMLLLSLDEEGSFFADFSAPSPIRGSFSGFITSGSIDVATDSLYVDLDRLFAIIPENGACECLGGVATGRLRVQGPLGDPEFYGAIYGTGVRLAVPDFLGAEVGPVPITATLEGNEMTFGPQYARVGGGAGIVNGWFRFERWIPDTFRIDIQVAESGALPYQVDIMGVVASGLASGTLSLAMENRELRVLGDLHGSNTDIVLDMDEIAARRDEAETLPPSVPWSVDITVTAEKKVDFYWPNTSMPNLRATAAAGSGVRITSDSLSGRMGMKGDVILKSGEINYVTRSFYLRDGMLSFDEDENSFAPRITARAELRERGEDGPVTIAMIVENEPLLNFSARFESTPPLSQAEIALVLGQSITGTGFGTASASETGEDSGTLGQSAVLAGTDIVVQYLGMARLERLIRNTLGLDMFSFRTSLLRNLVSTTMAWTPVDRRSAIGNYFDNTTVYIGKYVGSSMFIQGMLSIRYDDSALPQNGAFREGRGLVIGQTTSLEPDIGIELNTPLFDIRWNLTPVHVENLFVDDMSFTLIWRRAFR